MKKYLAEFIGTMFLVLFGCGTVVIAAADVGNLGVALAFGFGLIAAAYGIGTISGCHINPAVSLGVFLAGRMNAKDLGGYIVSQCLGAIAGAVLLLVILKGREAGYDAADGLGANGWGTGPDAYKMWGAFLFEFAFTFIFVTVILGVTGDKSLAAVAGLGIGITLVAIHLVGINITGTSVNPARSLGPALLVGGEAIEQLWLFLVAPTAGGLLAGLVYRFKAL
jgi:aquaporin Z